MSIFFNERFNLQYLVQQALPDLVRTYGYGVRRRLVVWSAKCVRGEEPYTLAMVLSEFSKQFPGLGFQFIILATDGSPADLQRARRGVYEERDIAGVPMELRKKYLLRSRDRARSLVRIAPEVRELVRFREVDLAEGEFRFRESLDIIFFHDTLGQLQKSTQTRLIERFYRHMSPGGYLFVEGAELDEDLDIPLLAVAPTVYRKT